jgi:hypothetical protein
MENESGMARAESREMGQGLETIISNLPKDAIEGVKNLYIAIRETI